MAAPWSRILTGWAIAAVGGFSALYVVKGQLKEQRKAEHIKAFNEARTGSNGLQR
ncbi:hypothetical protein DFJ77DRAFT_550563 [Powellomyces hirtus]|nr:hypothetical protein DFJ77DRAFT_550563 [Powellomyces hirtus]